MLYSRNRKYIFIHIPKAAGTSIQRSLKNIDQPTRLKRVWNRLTSQTSDLPLITLDGLHTHSDARQLRDAIGPETYADCFSFTFVRNPWDRMLSLYNNYWQGSFDRAEGRRLPKDLTPEEERENAIRIKSLGFRKWLLSEELQNSKYGQSLTKRSQMEWLRDEHGELITDYIGRVESITDDIKQIEQRLNVKIDLVHTNKSKHRNYRDEYCDETRDFVEHYFKEDVELFGYAF